MDNVIASLVGRQVVVPHTDPAPSAAAAPSHVASTPSRVPLLLHNPQYSLNHRVYSFDWSSLHARLKDLDSLFVRRVLDVDAPLAQIARDADDATAKAAASSSSGPTAETKGVLFTSFELDEPWSVVPLAEDASQASVFALPSSDPMMEMGPSYRFIKGPTGQLSVAAALRKILASVEQQMRAHGIRITFFLTSAIIVAADLDEALHRTGQVATSLKQIGFAVAGDRSTLVPRCLKKVPRTSSVGTPQGGAQSPDGAASSPQQVWSGLEPSLFHDRSATATFLLAAFRSLLNDAHVLGGRPWCDDGRGVLTMGASLSAAAARANAPPSPGRPGQPAVTRSSSNPPSGASAAQFEAYIADVLRGNPAALASFAATELPAAVVELAAWKLPKPGTYGEAELRLFNAQAGVLFDSLRGPTRQ